MCYAANRFHVPVWREVDYGAEEMGQVRIGRGELSSSRGR
jgi:hypothetical protein